MASDAVAIAANFFNIIFPPYKHFDIYSHGPRLSRALLTDLGYCPKTDRTLSAKGQSLPGQASSNSGHVRYAPKAKKARYLRYVFAG
jgi:hypothetical protein